MGYSNRNATEIKNTAIKKINKNSGNKKATE
jgi:hypothetical protein